MPAIGRTGRYAATVEILLGQQAVQRIPLEAVAFVVFIAQVQQAAIGVVVKRGAVAEGRRRVEPVADLIR